MRRNTKSILFLKKSFSLLLTVGILAGGLLGLGVNKIISKTNEVKAASGSISLSQSGSTTVGETLTVVVSANGEGMTGFDISLQWDGAFLQLNSLGAGSYGAGNFSSNGGNALAYGTTVASGSSLAVASFSVLQAGNSSVGCSGSLDFNGVNVGVSASALNITTVGAPPATNPPPVTTAPPATVKPTTSPTTPTTTTTSEETTATETTLVESISQLEYKGKMYTVLDPELYPDLIPEGYTKASILFRQQDISVLEKEFIKTQVAEEGQKPIEELQISETISTSGTPDPSTPALESVPVESHTGETTLSTITKITLVVLDIETVPTLVVLNPDKDALYPFYTFESVSQWYQISVCLDKGLIPPKYTPTLVTIEEEEVTAYVHESQVGRNTGVFLLYLMNNEGSSDFYRYDMTSKQAVRFIADPEVIITPIPTETEDPSLVTEPSAVIEPTIKEGNGLNHLLQTLGDFTNPVTILIYVLLLICLVLGIMGVRLHSSNKKYKKNGNLYATNVSESEDDDAEDAGDDYSEANGYVTDHRGDTDYMASLPHQGQEQDTDYIMDFNLPISPDDRVEQTYDGELRTTDFYEEPKVSASKLKESTEDVLADIERMLAEQMNRHQDNDDKN